MDQFQPGFRFSPSEEELINNHLMRKVLGYNDDWVIPELDDFYASDPSDLPRVHQGMSNVPSDGWEWFFLCPSPYVAQNSDRVKRKTKSGTWKITSQKDYIKARNTGDIIGTKKILTFYRSGVKTGWVMHEYHLNHKLVTGYSSTFQIPYVLCRLKRKPGESLDIDISPSFEGGSSATYDDTSAASQHGSVEQTDQESSYEVMMQSLSQLEMLDNSPLNDYSHYGYQPQPHVYDDGQGNDFDDPWGWR